MKNPETLDNTRAKPVLTQWKSGELRTVYPDVAIKGETIIDLPLQGW